MPAACHGLEPRPTNTVDDDYEDDLFTSARSKPGFEQGIPAKSSLKDKRLRMRSGVGQTW
jgi:hypothetical protein